ncbi:Flp family type IVb pilin [Aurantimonas sp. C2-6-R+9]|uniref:Flp family type IVb pilin n=1 Tax=unclassified Aurantimonas TaxID=2638230 RepID=UPI002E1928BE|nr:MULTISPECIES: Flp family type IVb pilin [unclassified Aurantimonas]MEC5291458.1 Flp family type IVb pilin [Aurantimonas sp. C2-3-R2]MEC5381722.1 Flp family type IVb pilin [Aurantimonas sp. C2-6-R+9]MEC5412546.1 Flp family type IVb pilin [Aurantimonas sp. C2-4-R8]
MLNWPRPSRQPGRARKAAKKLRYDISGATAIEYVMIAGLISIAIVVAATGIGTSVVSMFDGVLAAF